MATPGIYTYLHTLSLHDAVPSYGRNREIAGRLARRNSVPGRRARGTRPARRSRDGHRAVRALRCGRGIGSAACPNSPTYAPSETPYISEMRDRKSTTSELQSLMRISYAV